MSEPPGIIIAAPASGCGKTLFTLGLLRHLVRSGVWATSAKSGPDFIDPAFHAAASGRACVNLDPWAMRPATLHRAMATAARDSHLIVCEGVMGLFDGAVGTAGSTADLARRTGWPVVLIVDAHAQAASVAAVVRGFATHRAGVNVGGVVFNKVGSERHAAILADACAEDCPEVLVLGAIPRQATVTLPSRHLGLVQALEHPDLAATLDQAADLIATHVDVAALRRLAAPSTCRVVPVGPPLPPLGQRIAVAQDVAFTFHYPLTLDGWRAAGAEILPFSPLQDEAPASDCDAVYLPGGYPELHAGRLAANQGFLVGLRRATERAVVYGECGGYMVLGKGLVDGDGVRHAMAGLLPLETSFAEASLHLGYRRAECLRDTALGNAGSRFRGHEFHFSRTIEEGPGQPLFRCANARGDALGTTGLAIGTVMGSFIHLIDLEDPSEARPEDVDVAGQEEENSAMVSLPGDEHALSAGD